MQIGRNDPCPCGSGLKYKKCCLEKHSTINADELHLQKWIQIRTKALDKIHHCIQFDYGPAAIHEAWEEFHLWENSTGFDVNSPNVAMFFAWFFQEWSPDIDSESPQEVEEFIPAEFLLTKKTKKLSAEEKLYLESVLESTFSFFEVQQVEFNHSMRLQDILTGELHTVFEKSGSRTVQMGDIMFAKVFHIEDLAFLEATGPILIPPIFKKTIIDLRSSIQKSLDRQNQSFKKEGLKDFTKAINHQTLRDFGLEILEFYHMLFERITNPPPPVLTNTDGHLMAPHTLIYDIQNPQEIFDSLAVLCESDTKEGLLQQANLDKKGQIKSIEFPWTIKGNKKNKHWDNTVLGHLKIEKSKLTIDVNSKERATQFKALLKKIAPPDCTFVSMKKAKVTKSKNVQKEHDDLMQIPEVQEHIRKMNQAHWDQWIFEPLPALNGRTPIDAAKTSEGQELLEALLTSFERSAQKQPLPGQDFETFAKIRERLGL